MKGARLISSAFFVLYVWQFYFIDRVTISLKEVVVMYSNPYFTGYQNPYMAQNQNTAQRYDIIKVNGENGARALQMSPNSSILLLDESQPIVWLKTTDGAGYPTITPYKIEPIKSEPVADLNSLEARIARLEGIINESNTASTKPE